MSGGMTSWTGQVTLLCLPLNWNCPDVCFCIGTVTIIAGGSLWLPPRATCGERRWVLGCWRAASAAWWWAAGGRWVQHGGGLTVLVLVLLAGNLTECCLAVLSSHAAGAVVGSVVW